MGPGQYGYSPDVTPKYSYNPAKAKQLLAEAGFPNGVAIDFYTANGRYINDRFLITSTKIFNSRFSIFA